MYTFNQSVEPDYNAITYAIKNSVMEARESLVGLSWDKGVLAVDFGKVLLSVGDESLLNAIVVSPSELTPYLMYCKDELTYFSILSVVAPTKCPNGHTVTVIDTTRSKCSPTLLSEDGVAWNLFVLRDGSIIAAKKTGE